MLKYLPVITPALLGAVAAANCGVSRASGASVPYRPPPAAFSVAWPILYFCLGLAWFYERQRQRVLADAIFGSLSVVLALWIYFYSCQNDRVAAVWVIVVAETLAIMTFAIGDQRSRLLVAPLIGWLFFATLLSVAEFNSAPTSI